jgi:ADP-ribosylglycohydrolase
MNGQSLNIGRMETMDLEEAAADTVMRGGDTDTNAAICGALLGAVCGRDAIPEQNGPSAY